MSVPVARESAARSWIPLLVAVLFATAIVSEERYGWFSRLQKISLAGGGIEFAPGALTSARPDTSPIGVSGGQRGEGRIGYLLTFMALLGTSIERDLAYAEEIGIKINADDFAKDLAFAKDVISPLGKRLGSIHTARGYNDLNIIVDRTMIDRFRAFTQGYAASAAGQAAAAIADREVISSLQAIWQKACDTQRQLADAEFLDASMFEKDDDKPENCATQRHAASELLNKMLSDPDKYALNWNLPYATLLSAMLLNAAGETDPAVRDLHRWLLKNPMSEKEPRKWFPIWRVHFFSAALLLRDNTGGTRNHALVLQYKKLVGLGETFLASNAVPGASPPPAHIVRRLQSVQSVARARASLTAGPRSWREQVKLFQDSDEMGEIWRTAVCANDLSKHFKRFMNAHLTNVNNYLYFLSEDFLYAKEKGLLSDMERYSDFLVKASMRCLQQEDSTQASIDARSSEANFLDTAASVQLALALAPREGRAEKREKLCKAADYIGKAIALHREVATLRKESPSYPEPRDKQIKAWEASKIWFAARDEQEFEEAGLILARRRDRVEGQLEQAGLSC
ncbi:MAG TPA: hypothetical protein VFK79_07110 [Xanthobacteraceae bacterium]|nr:hypothetical protein [Xanthobacteraceae bacterium]